MIFIAPVNLRNNLKLNQADRSITSASVVDNLQSAQHYEISTFYNTVDITLNSCQSQRQLFTTLARRTNFRCCQLSSVDLPNVFCIHRLGQNFRLCSEQVWLQSIEHHIHQLVVKNCKK